MEMYSTHNQRGPWGMPADERASTAAKFAAGTEPKYATGGLEQKPERPCSIANCPVHDGYAAARAMGIPGTKCMAEPLPPRPLSDNTRTVFKYRVCNGGGVVEEFDRKDLAFEYLEVADHVATDLGLKLFVQECRVEITEKDFGWRAIEPPTPKPEADDVDEYRHWEDCELAACARCDRYDELMDRY